MIVSGPLLRSCSTGRSYSARVKVTPGLAVIVSAVLFGLMHCSFTQFFAVCPGIVMGFSVSLRYDLDGKFRTASLRPI